MTMPWRKAAVIAGFSVLWFVVSVMRVPGAIPRHHDIGVDVSWVVGLPEALRQGDISGRDFHYTYGPLGQLLAFAGAWFHEPWAAVDALPLILLAFYTASIGLLAIILLLLNHLDWKVCVLIYLSGAALNLFSEPTSFRPLALMLCAAVVYRSLEARSESAMFGWAAGAGAMCLAGQLITVEVGLYGIAAAAGAFVIQAALKRRRNLLTAAGLAVVSYLSANLTVSAAFAWSSTSDHHWFDYQRYAFDMIRGYSFTAGVPWELTAAATLGLATVAGFTAATGFALILNDGSAYATLVLPLLLASLLSLKSAFIRSDTGHITQALSPLVFMFVLIAGLCVFERRSWKKLAKLAGLSGLLWLSWPWAGAYAASDLLRAARVESPFGKLVRLRTLSATVNETLPAGLAAALGNAGDAPLLAFPHENYIPAKLERRMLAPVFLSFNASTEALQQFYVEELERRAPRLNVIYGMDNLDSATQESVQSVSRVPLIFDYLHRHFQLAGSGGFGKGFYLLSRSHEERRFVIRETAAEVRRPNAAAVEVRPQNPSSCGLLRLRLRLNYSMARYFGRPDTVDVTLFRDGMPFLKTGLVAIQPNARFWTYVSLIADEEFYKVFGNQPVPAASWDLMRIEARPSDWLGVSPQIEVDGIDCVRSPE